MTRFSLMPVFRAHWRALSDYRQPGTPRPDRAARFVVVTVPLAAIAAMLVLGGTLRNPDALLSALALLAGGFLTAFTHLSGVRGRLTDREEIWGEVERTDRDSLDETTAHLLAASYVSILSAALVLAGMNLTASDNGTLTGAWAAITAGSLTYLGLIAMIVFPRLYTAYATTNRVRTELNGNTKGRFHH